MLSDLDTLMAARGLDGLLVMGDSSGNPVMQYLLGNVHFERAVIYKPTGGDITLIHGSMERDNAAHTGYRLVDRDQVYNSYAYLQRHEGNQLDAAVHMMVDILRDSGMRGTIGFYGMQDVGAGWTLLNNLADRLDGIDIQGEFGQTLFTEARATKDNRELAELAELGRRTCTVVHEVEDFLTGHAVAGDHVVKEDGTPLTIGDVRMFLRGRLQRQELAEDHQTIFAQGAEAGVPHNAGTNSVRLRTGSPIIFDIFPKGRSGYFHDMTRTWCLGHAPDHVAEAWTATKQLFDEVMARFRVGEACASFQAQACDFYEGLGHPTPRTHPGTHEGYVHSLGHGIGLDVHEGPNLSLAQGNTDVLRPGHVITVEPGLYYPDRGWGVRHEDAVALDEDGELVWLTNYPAELVLPMRG